ncbi:TIGR03118 family protein [Nonomuraea sp. KC401]|uniref:TIGR03118 family protein n=1 Tax=unclassified Nonomuraea TaxID=2593643 RepID=UPI0010FD8E06|nr:MULTISPECIES: TIGR03118 family protein [unclassified Nonomuraea]NBE93005.1 TIGR03118 family protein [Nonomuraea sp. K271]TLF78176.1 TIGR03118 family protein [Nonomuraea sp. KC401]
MRPRIITLCAVAVVLGATLTTPAHATTRTRFDVINLVSDVKGKAPVTDPKVVNPWGLAMGKTLWVSNTGTGTATVYSGTGKKEETEVAIPGGAPTGQVFNPGDGFTVKGKPATFIFSSPSGAITGWNAEVDPANAVIAAFTRGADYKGLELAETDDGAFLLAADFAGGRVHAFDEDFERIRLSRWQFRDKAVPSTYKPYNVAVVNGNVWVSYALRDKATGKPVFGESKGFVSRFDGNGRLTGRISRVGLNAPWGLTAAPKGWGQYAGALLVGNFGDGTVHAYKSGRHLGALRLSDGKPIVLPGLWDLEPGTAATGGEKALWFSAGIDGAKHGLIGVIAPQGTKVSSSNASNGPSKGSSGTPAPRSSKSPYGGY